MKINLDFVWPIGSIYETTSTVHPNVSLGGSWELYGTGRVTVCIDENDVHFQTIDKIGGHKDLAKHRHIGIAWFGDFEHQAISLNSGSGNGYHLTYGGGTVNDQKYNVYTDYAGTGTQANLQPYIVVYRYRRIA